MFQNLRLVGEVLKVLSYLFFFHCKAFLIEFRFVIYLIFCEFLY